MSIYKTLLESADKGGRYKIDLNKKDLWIGRKQYIKEGVMQVEDELIDKHDLARDFGIVINVDSWEVIKYLYKQYKVSVPNSKWKDKSYFKALPVDELTDADRAYNIDRKYGQAMLEGYILLASLAGWIEWQNEDQWFWQDEEDEDLIVLKQWI